MRYFTDETTGLWKSSGKIPVRKSAAEGALVQIERQKRDEELKIRAGERSEYVHRTTLSRPFGTSKGKVQPWKNPEKEVSSKIRKENLERNKRYWNPQKKQHRLPLDGAIRLQVLARDNYTCRYCGTRKGPYHVDHVIPWSKGGPDTLENLVTACVKCNLTKGTETWVPTNNGM